MTISQNSLNQAGLPCELNQHLAASNPSSCPIQQGMPSKSSSLKTGAMIQHTEWSARPDMGLPKTNAWRETTELPSKSQSKYGTELVYPEQCNESKRRLHPFMACPLLAFIYPGFEDVNRFGHISTSCLSRTVEKEVGQTYRHLDVHVLFETGYPSSNETNLGKGHAENTATSRKPLFTDFQVLPASAS